MQAGQDQFQISKPVRLVLAVVLMGLLVFLDYSSGPQINLSILYLLPICLAAWEAGFWAGLILSIASAVIWFMAEYR